MTVKEITVSSISEVPKDFTGIAHHPCGGKSYHLNGKIHREDGPAVEDADGQKQWLLNDCLHREDGPAIVWPNGNEYFYLNDERYTMADWYVAIAKLKAI
jgi:hypothetical protein